MLSVCFSWYTACFRDELNNVVKEEDGEWICFSGGNNLLGTKKYRGSNSSDGGNTRDGVKIAGGVIGSGGGIGSIRIHIEQRIAAMIGHVEQLEGDVGSLHDESCKIELN
ncbi:hypothetical protein Tco_0472091 [Tanacetum coccineum]